MKQKYSGFKIFHYKDKLDSLPESVDEILAPVHIRIKPTNVCNHNCWYCAYRSDDLQLGQDMNIKDSIPEDKMFEIIDDCVDMGVKAITFSGGGEPFVYKYFVPVLRKLADTDISFASLTNGARLSGEAAEIFAEKGKWIRISIDGWNAESYGKYRGVSDKEFDKVINNIRNFKKLNGDCTLGISYIVDNQNYKHVFDFAKLMKDCGADNLKISPCIVSNDGEENDRYHADCYDEAKELSVKTKELLSDKSFEVNECYHRAEIDFSKNYDWCPFSQILPVIGADQNIYPCQDKAYNLEDGLVGSIKDMSFKEFWFSDKSKFFKINPSKVCKHHCVANGKNNLIFEYLNIDEEHLGFV